MINGQVSSKLSYDYWLMAAEVGDKTIGAASVTAGGKTLKTEPVKITVKKGAAVSNKNTNGKNQNAGKPDLKNNLFIKLHVNKNNLYQGEQLIATYKIYTRLSIVDNEVNSLPSFNGFWTQDVELPQHTALKNEVINGQAYQVATIKKAILFPQRSGKLKVDPISLDVVVRLPQQTQSRSIFDQFFGRYKDVKYTITSNAQTITVKGLPNNKPASFDGAVGKFSFAATIDKNEVETNDAINLKISINGQGNIKMLNDLDIKFPSDFEVYDPKSNDQISTANGILSGKRTYEYLIIPRHAGEFQIDPIEFAYFDVKSKSYVELKSGQFDIKVNKGANDETQNVAYSLPNRKEVQILGEDIKYIKNEMVVEDLGATFIGTLPYYFTLSMPWLLFILFIFYKKNREDKEKSFDLKSRKANKVALQKLAKAKSLSEGDSSGFMDAIYESLFGYLSDKFNIPLSQLSIKIIKEKCDEFNISESTSDRLTSVLNDCEMSKFAPMQNADNNKIYQDSIKIITEIENALK